jgi:hypothetical protein
MLRDLKMRLEFGTNFDRLVDRIRELDRDDEQYLEMLRAPRLPSWTEQSVVALRSRWLQIFDAASRQGDQS